MATALTFPLALADFFDGLSVSSIGFDLTESMTTARTAGGEVLVADYAERLWTFQVRVRTNTHVEMRKAEALARALRQADRAFFAYDVANPYPASDPGGTSISGSSPTIDTLDADNKRMKITGLPAGYVLTRGDLLSFTYGASPTRYALHEVLTNDVTADGTGLTPLFEVSPFIRSGATTGTAVTLSKPYCKAVMMPGSFQAGARRAGVTGGFSFEAMQTLR